jgi:aspartate/methionine/tyrosine aminotransferase
MRQRFARALGKMKSGLVDSGFAVIDPASTYFMCVDLRASGVEVDDETFAKRAVEEAGVAVVPISAFAEHSPARHLVRLCFAKRDETIDAGVAAMARARELLA